MAPQRGVERLVLIAVTVYRPKGRKTWRYDFEWRGRRYHGSTGQLTQRDAQEWERNERVRLARQAGDLSLRAGETPRIQDWAEVFMEYKASRMKRPDLLEREVRVVLEFCGAKPSAPPAPRRPGAPPRRTVPIAPPYRDLRLGDFIEEPELILNFEMWMRARGTGHSARNHYRSVMSGMYRVAMLPQYRRMTGIRSNPFASIERERAARRRVTQTVDELRRWIAAAAPHVQLALAIGALAPALRLGNILALRWDRNVDSELRFITVQDHKGDRATSEALVVPIVAQLRALLELARTQWNDARLKNPRTAMTVIQFRGRAVESIKKGLKRAAVDAGVTYGLKAGGATFHTLRHTMATMLAELQVPERVRSDLLGHSDIATTQIYTHLRPVHLLSPLEQLSAAVPLQDVMVGKPAGPGDRTLAESGRNGPKRAKRKTGRTAQIRPKKRARSA